MEELIRFYHSRMAVERDEVDEYKLLSI